MTWGTQTTQGKTGVDHIGRVLEAMDQEALVIEGDTEAMGLDMEVMDLDTEVMALGTEAMGLDTVGTDQEWMVAEATDRGGWKLCVVRMEMGIQEPPYVITLTPGDHIKDTIWDTGTITGIITGIIIALAWCAPPIAPTSSLQCAAVMAYHIPTCVQCGWRHAGL